jgi:hypothetical protein
MKGMQDEDKSRHHNRKFSHFTIPGSRSVEREAARALGRRIAFKLYADAPEVTSGCVVDGRVFDQRI